MAAKPLAPIPPGEILQEDFMKPAGLSINELAREIDVPPNRISEIVNGKRAISADTALRLGKYFGVSPEVWLGLQSDYDLRLAKQTTWPKIEARVKALASRRHKTRYEGLTDDETVALAVKEDDARIRGYARRSGRPRARAAGKYVSSETVLRKLSRRLAAARSVTSAKGKGKA